MDITNTEIMFMDIVWDKSPIKSTELVSIAAQRLGWKKSTTYTVIKNLCNKGIIKNENAVVTCLTGRTEVAAQKSVSLADRVCKGSVQMFLASFLSGRKLKRKEADELKKIIDSFTEKGDI